MVEVYILHGQNSVDIEDRVAQLREGLDPGGYSTTAYEISAISSDELASALATPPFFGSARVIVLRGTPGTERTGGIGWDDLETLLAAGTDSTVVILASPQKIPANRRILKTVKQRGWVVEAFDVPYGQALVRWVQDRAAREAASMPVDPARTLLDRLYPTAWQREDRWNPQTINVRLIATEVAKLAAASAGTEIESSLVQALVADRSGVTAFKLNDETFDGRSGPALAELDNVLSSGEAAERVVAQIGYQPLVLLAAGRVQAYGVEAVSEAAGVSAGQLNATIGRKTAWRDGQAVRGAAEELRRSEWLVKTGRAPDTAGVLPGIVGGIAERFRVGNVRR